MKGLLAAIALLTFPLAAQAACLNPGDAISGEVRDVKTVHPGNGMILQYHFLVLPKPVCVVDRELGRADGRWIQIALKDQKDLPRLVLGDWATITADYQPPMTAYHIGDIMAFDAHIVRVSAP